MDQVKQGTDALFILLGAIMVLAMHAGFAFLELGTVRKKNQVNALVKILVDFAVSTIAYFFVGYAVAYGVQFFSGAETLAAMEKVQFVLGNVLLGLLRLLCLRHGLLQACLAQDVSRFIFSSTAAVLSFTGQISTHKVQPVQSSGATCNV